MENKSNQFSPQEAMHLINSPAGQQLLTILRQSDPQALQKAMQQASAGNYDQIPKTLATLMQSKDVQNLLKQMGG